jgi:hypothetical protein
MLSKTLIIAIALAMVLAPVHAQTIEHDGCIVDVEIWQLPACAIEQRDGHFYVAARYLDLFDYSGPYRLAWSKLPDTFPGAGWTYFDRQGHIVVQQVATLDNGPSPIHHGIVRIQQAGKFGLAKLDGTNLVPLIYDSILEPDKNGHWEVCIGCQFTHHGDHEMLIQEGNWFWLGRSGKLLSPKPHKFGSER